MKYIVFGQVFSTDCVKGVSMNLLKDEGLCSMPFGDKTLIAFQESMKSFDEGEDVIPLQSHELMAKFHYFHENFCGGVVSTLNVQLSPDWILYTQS
jgi:hypothetical protein